MFSSTVCLFACLSVSVPVLSVPVLSVPLLSVPLLSVPLWSVYLLVCSLSVFCLSDFLLTVCHLQCSHVCLYLCLSSFCRLSVCNCTQTYNLFITFSVYQLTFALFDQAIHSRANVRKFVIHND